MERRHLLAPTAVDYPLRIERIALDTACRDTLPLVPMTADIKAAKTQTSRKWLAPALPS
jgi:hypothetical protein